MEELRSLEDPFSRCFYYYSLWNGKNSECTIPTWTFVLLISLYHSGELEELRVKGEDILPKLLWKSYQLSLYSFLFIVTLSVYLFRVTNRLLLLFLFRLYYSFHWYYCCHWISTTLYGPVGHLSIYFKVTFTVLSSNLSYDIPYLFLHWLKWTSLSPVEDPLSL